MKNELLLQEYFHLKEQKRFYKVVFIYYNSKNGLWEIGVNKTKRRMNRMIKNGVPVIEIH